MKSLDQIRQERIKKVEELNNLGLTAYPQYSGKRVLIKDAREMMDKEVEVVGRVFSVRGHGKLLFADLHDETEKIQLMFKSDVLNEQNFKLYAVS